MAGMSLVTKCNRSLSMNKKTIRTADAIASLNGKYVLIERQKFPFGLAIPGGHIDPGEQPMQTAIRELTEETGLSLHDAQFITRRKGKKRDPRYAMSETSVYAGTASGVVKNEEGFTKVVLFTKAEILKMKPERFVFDHHDILVKYLRKS